MAAGAGSVWNANSWHWEEKTYTTWAKEDLTERFGQLVVEGDNLNITFPEVSDFKGTAALNIRKGKKIPVVDLTMKVKFEAVRPSAPGSKPAHGFVSVADLIADEIEDDFDIMVTPKTAGPKSDDARRLLASKGASAIRGVFRAFFAALQQRDGGDAALTADAARRQAEAAVAAEAAAKSAAEQEAIAKARAAEEAAMAAAEAERAAAAQAAATAAAGPQPVPAPAAQPEGTGSVWNPNSYHWEEKPLTAWAAARLRELLTTMDVDLPGGTFKITDITELKGDASASIRKGKKLLFFDFDIKGQWEGEIVDGEGDMLATADGEWHIPEIDQDTDLDDPAECEVRVTTDKDGDRADERLKDLARQHAVPHIREVLKQFVADMRASMAGSLDFILPPPDARGIVDKTAEFVAKNGPEFEAKIKEKQGADVKFSFLEPDDPYHAYYREKVKRLEAGDTADLAEEVAKAREAAEAAAAAEDADASEEAGAGAAPAEDTAVTRAAVITPYLAAKKRVPEGPPPKLQFALVHPTHLHPAEVDRIKLTAQYTAAGGREFLGALTAREAENPAYGFLKPSNANFAYFTALVDAYSKVINPPPELRRRVAGVAQAPLAAFVASVHRVEWQRAEEERRALETESAAASQAMAAIDWHDFEVVDTITLTGQGVEGGVAAPAVQAAAPTASSTYTGPGVSSSEPVRGAGGSDDDMDMSDMEEGEEEEGGVGGGQTSTQAGTHTDDTPGGPATAAVGGEDDDDDDEVINVQAGYVPIIPPQAGRLTHFRDPKTGQAVPIDSIAEHMRIRLLDPRWRKETQRALEKQKTSSYVTGEDVAENLRRLAARRADVFGAEAAKARAAVGDTAAGSAHAQVAWDGDYASADAMAAARKQAAAAGLIHNAAGKATGTEQGPQLPPASKRARTE